MIKFLTYAVSGLLLSAQAKAALVNSGVYLSPNTVNVGQTLVLRNSILATSAQSGVKVVLEVRKVSSSNVIEDAVISSQTYSDQNFSTNENKVYSVNYTVPSNVASGTYAYVIKATNEAGTQTYLQVREVRSNTVFNIIGAGSAPVVAPTPTATPVATPISTPVAAPVEAGSGLTSTYELTNAGAYISPSNAGVGQNVRFRNAVLAASKAMNNVQVVLEVRPVVNSSIGSSVVLSRTFAGQNFALKEVKTYEFDYTIPAGMASGQYAYVIKALNASGSVLYLNIQEARSPYVFQVSGNSAAVPAPAPIATPAPTATPAPVVTPVPSTETGYLRGINIMDLGIAGHVIPGVYGTNYTKPSAAAIKALRERGLGVIRISFHWERLQPTLGGSLNSAYLGYLMDVLRDSNAVGMKVIVDMHNYGRYQNASSGVISRFGDAAGPTTSHYADGWKKIVTAIKADSRAYNAVYAWDIMNEPYDLPSVNGMTPQKLWEVYSQSAVDGIRSIGEGKIIMVEGYSFSSATLWPVLHPVPWIKDSANNTMYQAHSYMDNNSGGVFTATFAQETAFAKSQGFASVGARAVARVKKFTDWLATHKVKGFLGEYGWPNAHMVGGSDAASWNQAGEELLDFLDSVNLGATMWATGTWLGPTTNILNAYVLPGNGGQGLTPLSQTSVMEAHPGK